MPIFILGYQTPSASEIPEVLYLGDDGDEAAKVAENAPHPRVARMVNPMVQPIRHWSEDHPGNAPAPPPAKASKK